MGAVMVWTRWLIQVNFPTVWARGKQCPMEGGDAHDCAPQTVWANVWPSPFLPDGLLVCLRILICNPYSNIIFRTDSFVTATTVVEVHIGELRPC